MPLLEGRSQESHQEKKERTEINFRLSDPLHPPTWLLVKDGSKGSSSFLDPDSVVFSDADNNSKQIIKHPASSETLFYSALFLLLLGKDEHVCFLLTEVATVDINRKMHSYCSFSCVKLQNFTPPIIIIIIIFLII